MSQTTRKQVDDRSQLHKSQRLPRLTGLTKVLDSQSRRPRSRVNRERAQGFGNLIGRHLLGKGQGGGVNRDSRLLRVKHTKSLSSVRGLRAEAFLDQGIARLGLSAGARDAAGPCAEKNSAKSSVGHP